MKNNLLKTVIIIAYALCVLSLIWMLYELVVALNWWSVLAVAISFGFLMLSGWLKIKFENPNNHGKEHEGTI